MKQELSTVAIDLAKKVFHLVGTDTTGNILWRKRLSRNALMSFIAQLPPVLIGMEACGGAHYCARRFREHGHEVKLMAPQFSNSNFGFALDLRLLMELTSLKVQQF
jgi:transposase